VGGLAILYEIKTSLLGFAFLGLDQVSDKEIKENLVKFFKEQSLTSGEIKGYQQGSGPDKLGRHLFTQLVVDSLNRDISSRKINEDLMFQKWEHTFKDIIKKLKDEYREEYKNSVIELDAIIQNTQNLLRHQGMVKLRRKLTQDEEYCISRIKKYRPNHIASFSTDTFASLKASYSADYYSDKVLEASFDYQNIIIHPDYHIVNFEYGELEAIVFFPEAEIQTTGWIIK
jgi:hypothetical protein